MTLTVLFAAGGEDPDAWLPALRAAFPEGRFVTEPEDAVAVALVADRATGLERCPRLRLIQSLWAGVERIVDLEPVRRGVPLARMVEPGLGAAMTEAVLTHVLWLHRELDVYARERRWAPRPYVAPADRRVVVLGLGELGRAAALALRGAGFAVTGWSRTRRELDGVASTTDLGEALARADILVDLLPLTDATRGLLDAQRLALLPANAALINVARSEHIDDDALLDALDAGRLRHAVLDVFRTEPLPEDHPFWAHPRVTVTPHIAGPTDVAGGVAVVAENLRRVAAGEPPLHLVDLARGY